MSQFYARYVPPVAKPGVPPASANSSSPAEKRKRDEPSISQTKKSKRRKTSNDSRGQENETSTSTPSGVAISTSIQPEANPTNILDKYRVTTAGKSVAPVVTVVNGGSSKEIQAQSSPDTKDEMKKTKRRKKKDPPAVNEERALSEDPVNKHASILSRFEQARQQERLPLEDDEDGSENMPPVELHGLEPIPQPEQIEHIPIKPTYSTLPSWQKTPLEVPSDVHHSFKSLGVPDSILANLHKHGLKDAFPIQSTVLPLLMNQDSKHDGDICVSASTGSGKTLAYVLPLVASLKELTGPKLRAVIVVPTRELVKQVRELCEICAAGSRLQIATAVGSSSLKDEQDQLVLEESVYNPHRYELQQQSTVDWANFSLQRLVRQSHEGDLLDSVGFISEYRSKADILITTPGRLVDHLKSTPGFNLDNVKWLVVDEADRLLNESYQEWIEVVSPALASNVATAERDRLLRSMRMTPSRRQVRKILLSATMTSDISKLNSLGLYRPLLVVLGSDPKAIAGQPVSKGSAGSSSREVGATTGGTFHLPASLSESVVTISDPSQKPLYLLQLLSQELEPGDKLARPKSSSNALTADLESTPSSPSSSSASSSTDSSLSISSSSSSDDDDDSSSSDSSSSSEASAAPRGLSRDEHLQTKPQHSPPRALIFTRSTAAATRLSRLLRLLKPSWSGLISTLTKSTAASADSRRALSAFRNSKISILIATDRASRGLDVPGLEHVISYDVPSSALTYVHRVGRTARAGNPGHAWTFLERREGAWFWREIGGKLQAERAAAENLLHRQSKVKQLTISIEEDTDLQNKYEAALKQLGEEARG